MTRQGNKLFKHLYFEAVAETYKNIHARFKKDFVQRYSQARCGSASFDLQPGVCVCGVVEPSGLLSDLADPLQHLL